MELCRAFFCCLSQLGHICPKDSAPGDIELFACAENRRGKCIYTRTIPLCANARVALVPLFGNRSGNGASVHEASLWRELSLTILRQAIEALNEP